MDRIDIAIRTSSAARAGSLWGVGALLLGLAGCGASSAPQASTLSAPARASNPSTTVEVTGPAGVEPAGGALAERAAPAVAAAPPVPAAVRAGADLLAKDGSSLGTVTFEQVGGQVVVSGRFAGLAPGAHGFSVQQATACGGAGADAAVHFNPGKQKHGSLGSSTRHLGDLGNLDADRHGEATFAMTTDSFTLTPGPDSVVGHALVIHARKDDGKTQPAGASGPDVACGLIVAKGEVASGIAK